MTVAGLSFAALDGSEMLRVCGIGILAAIVSVVLRELSKEMALPVKFGGAVLLFGAALLLFLPVAEELMSLWQGGETAETVTAATTVAMSHYVPLLFRATGIAFLCELSAGLCRDMGEGTLASGIELAGKACILSLSLPMITEALHSAGVLLSWA